MDGESNPILECVEGDDDPPVGTMVHPFIQVQRTEFVLFRDEIPLAYFLKGLLVNGGSGIDVGVGFFR